MNRDFRGICKLMKGHLSSCCMSFELMLYVI